MVKSINSIVTLLITSFAIVITIIISSISVYSIMTSNDKSLDVYRKEVYNNNKDMIRYQTQIAINIAHQIYNKQLSGEYTKEEAMNRVASTIRNIKSDNGGYFFIYDVEGNAIALFGSNLERTNKLNATSSDGTQYVRQIIDSTRNNPSGDYNMINVPKPYGDDGEQEKIVFSKLFTPYNWVIGTGIYTNDIEADIAAMNKGNNVYLNKVIALLIFISVSLWFITYFIAKKISYILVKPLLHITDRMNRISSGYLDKNRDDIFSDEIFGNTFNEFDKLNKASNVLTKNLNSIIGFMTQSIDKISGISNNVISLSTTNSKYTENINETINNSYTRYENELDSISILYNMIQKDKSSLQSLKNELINIHITVQKYTSSINIMKDSVANILTIINNNKDRNLNSICTIKEITSEYDKVNTEIGLISNILFQNNMYIGKIVDSMSTNPDYDITNDINSIKNLNYRAQETINVLHSILINILHTFKDIDNSVDVEIDTLTNSAQYLDNSNIIFDSGIERVDESCKDICNVISEMEHVIDDLDIQYVALDELNTKFKDINKEIQLVINYSNDVNDNMDKISVFVSQLGVVTNKIQELIKKIKR